jgi:hypothetical protein
LGEILIPVGEFLENNHILLESPYVKEWAEQVCNEKGLNYPESFEEAMEQVKLGLPLAPCYLPFLSDIDDNDFDTLLNGITENGEILTDDARTICYRLAVNVKCSKGNYFLSGKRAEILKHWATHLRELVSDESVRPIEKIYQLSLKSHLQNWCENGKTRRFKT